MIINWSIKKIIPTLIFPVALGILLVGGALANDETGAPAVESFKFPQAANGQSDDVTSLTNENTSTNAQYTLQELQDANALPLLEVVMPEGALVISESEKLPADAVPGYSLGWSPQSGLPQPDPTIGYVFADIKLSSSPADLQVWGSAPASPLNGVYAPFQRWTWYGNYVAQDTQTIGRLFFDTDSNGEIDSSCTATVISDRTIVTAGHCISNGAGGWYSMFTFCPSYYKGGGSGAPFPTRGCWDWNEVIIWADWHNSSAIDSNYGCIITTSTGDTVPATVGSVTGWVGRVWNFPSIVPIFSWGYPSESPFPGYHVIVAAGPEWYEVDMTSDDGQVSKYMGNDMTDGSSGGPWWMSVSHKTAEYNDTDGRWQTDPPGSAGLPGGAYLNGINSHRRCLSSCFTPPLAASGTFWQEMGSPQFSDQSESLFGFCLENE